MGMAAPVYYTAEMVRGLPDDGNRYETVHGELLVTPAPRMWHQVVVERLRHALGIYLARLRHLELVVEVLSPTTARADRFTKRRLYQEVGIPAYWIVDADEHFVEIWTPEAALPRVELERVVWASAGAAEPLVLSLPELFRPV